MTVPEKYQKEIEEILEQAGGLVSSSRPARIRPSLLRLVRQYISNSLGGRLWSLNPGRIMAVAVALLLLALLFTRIVPGIGGPVALAGLLLFIVGYGMFFVQPWRGQPIEQDDSSWWSRFRRKR